MRRKSKKIKEEAKVESSSERRSKRSSTRRKKAYEEDEGGSGVEEGRTTEEEMTPTKNKDKGGRRYATRGRRQKEEESEGVEDEEVSQTEEERVDNEEESSNNLPVEIEADDKEAQAADSADDSKGFKAESTVTIAEKAIVPEGNDGSSAWKTDTQFWEMKSNKNDQEDKHGGNSEEASAQGEGDDGEEEVSRSHSRKRKLKLSRECLHENREAIPKIRLRLSRNRSGGYDTEKLEAERIDSNKAEEETVVEVIKVENVAEEKGAEVLEQGISIEPAEVNEAEITEVVEQDSKAVDEVKTEEVKSEDLATDEVKTEEFQQENNTAKQEEEYEASPKAKEDTDSTVVETLVEEEKVGSSVVVVQVEELRTNEAVEPAVVCDDVGESVDEGVVVIESPKDSAEERTEQETEVKMDAEECVKEEETEDTAVLPAIEEKKNEEDGEEAEHVKQVEVESEAQKDCEEERRDADESQENQVSQSEVVERVAEEKDDEEERPSDVEKAKDCENEDEVKGDSEVVAEENESSKVDEICVPKETEQTESKDNDEDCNNDDKKVASDGEGEVREVQKEKEERNQKSGGERASRINRARLRQEDDIGEEGENRRRRRRSRSRESSGSGRQPTTSTAPEQPQPKRVSLKRPKLIRSTSSVPVKEITSEEKEQKVESDTKSKEEEEEENQSVAISDEAPSIADKEVNQEGIKPKELESTPEEEGIKKRRRKWGQQKSQVGPSQSKRAFISISTQSLKGLIPEVKPLPIHELRLSVEKDDVKDICMEEEESCEASVDETIVRMIDANGQNERTIWAQVIDDDMRPIIHPEAPRVPLLGGGDSTASVGPVRRISIVSDDAIRLQRSPSPPRHPPSSVLFLSNLVRPFTVQQLKELLARTGTVVEDGFWIDRIKSMCFVQYETEEQARETRHALHGVRWPISNPKRLWVDFATRERLEEAKREGNIPPPPPAAGPSLTPPHPAPRDDFPRKTEPLRVDGSGMMPLHHPPHRGAPGSPGRQGHAMILQQGPIIGGGTVTEGVPTDSVGWQQRGRPRPEPPPLRPGANARDFKLSAPVREWDLDKVVQQSPPRLGIHGPSRGGPMDERRRPDVAGQPGGRRDRMLPSPPPSLQEMQARKVKRKEAEAAAAAAAEAPANLLDSLFRKTKATPSIYWLPLTADQIKVKEEIRRQHLAEHERRMAEMKRAADKERGGRRRRRSSSPRRRSRRRSGEGSSAVRKKPNEILKGRKTGSASPKK